MSFGDLDLYRSVFDNDRDDFRSPQVVDFFPDPTRDPGDTNSNPSIAEILRLLQTIGDTPSLNNGVKTPTASSCLGAGTSSLPKPRNEPRTVITAEETSPLISELVDSRCLDTQEVLADATLTQEWENTDNRSLGLERPLQALGGDNNLPQGAAKGEAGVLGRLDPESGGHELGGQELGGLEDLIEPAIAIKRPTVVSRAAKPAVLVLSKPAGTPDGGQWVPRKVGVVRIPVEHFNQFNLDGTLMGCLDAEYLLDSEYFSDSGDSSDTECFPDASETGSCNGQDSEDPEDGESGPSGSHNNGGQGTSGGGAVSESSGSISAERAAGSSSRRRSRERDDDDGRGDEGRRKRRNSSPNRRQPGKKTKPNLRRFACPYQVFYPPRRCLAKSSRNPEGGCDGIRRLTQHLARKHMISHRCPRCWISMDSKDKVERHAAKNECRQKRQPDNERFLTSDQELQVRNGSSFPTRDEDAWWWVSKIIIPEIQGSNDEELKLNHSPFYGDLDRSNRSTTIPVIGWAPSNLAPEEPFLGDWANMDILEALNMNAVMTPSFIDTQEATQGMDNVGLHNNASPVNMVTQGPEVQCPAPSFIDPSAVTPVPQTPYTPAAAGDQTATTQALFTATSPTYVETPALPSPSLTFSPVAPEDDQQQWAQPQILTPAKKDAFMSPAAMEMATAEASTHEIRLQKIINRLTHDVEELEAKDTENKKMKEASSKALRRIQDLLNKVLATKGLEEGVYQTLEEVADTLVTVKNGLR